MNARKIPAPEAWTLRGSRPSSEAWTARKGKSAVHSLSHPADVAKVIKENETYKERNRQHREIIADLQERLKARHMRELGPLEQELEDRDATIDELKSKIKSLERKIQKKDSTISGHDEIYSEMSENKAMLEKTLHDAEKYITNFLIEVKSHTASPKTKRDSAKVLGGQISEMRLLVTHLLNNQEKELSKLRKSCGMHEKEAKEHYVQLKWMQKKEAKVNKAIENLLEMIQQKGFDEESEEENSIIAELNRKPVAIENLASVKKCLSKTLGYHDTVTRLELEVATLSNINRNLKTANSELKIKCSNLEGRNIILEGQNKILKRTHGGK